MIKIIKEGIRKPINCPQCGCLFSYEQEDIRKEVNDYKIFPDRNSVAIINKKEFYINCPQCYYKIILKKEKE